MEGNRTSSDLLTSRDHRIYAQSFLIFEILTAGFVHDVLERSIVEMSTHPSEMVAITG